jgi:hypothetical protein
MTQPSRDRSTDRAAPRSGDWWPGGMGHPHLAGYQSGMGYAYFANAQRLAIDRFGTVTLHDTRGHDIRGVLPALGPGALRFSSADGPVAPDELPVVSGPVAAPGN